jgi:YhcH/YjgK/YiaL family protein
MNSILLKIMVLISFAGLFGRVNGQDPAKWSSTEIDKWFEKGEWLNGWNITPDISINRKEFAVSYFKNKERWDKAFIFLKSNDLSKLEIKRYDIEGDMLYASVMEYVTKNEEDAKYEAHRQYIDIQYVIDGIEEMGVAPLSSMKEVTIPYDASKDVGFMTVKEGKFYNATPDRFFIFFPSDIHRPGLKVGQNSQLKKIVVKVKVD